MPSGVPFIMAKDLIDCHLDLANCNFITRQLADTLRIGFAKPGDVLLTHKATMGRVAIVPDGYDYIMLTPQVTYYRIGDRSRLDARFLKCAFLSPPFQHQLNATSDQSTRKYIGISAQRDLWIPVPPPAEQRAIAHILGTLDDKIELNRQMNETLEAMARAIFKSWFIDFDPVRAKAEGRDPGLPKPLADLFPDSFEDSELGEIPKGWRVGKISDLAILSRDGVTPGDFPDEVFDHYSIPAFDEGRTPTQEAGEAIKSNKSIVPADCVLLSKLNPRLPRVWLPDVQSARRSVCSTEYLIAVPRLGVPRKFLYGLLSSDAFLSEFATLVTGTSGSHQRVKPESLLQMDTVIGPESIVQRFASWVTPLLERVRSNIADSGTLAALRDTLLPKLISGELRVGTARESMEGVPR